MSSADLLEDGFPHGTRQGYADGCRGGACPAGIEHGLSCRRANMLASGDYRYQKLVKAGAKPAEIADQLGLNPEIPAAPAPKKRPTLPVEPVPAKVASVVPRTARPSAAAREQAKPAAPAKWAVRHAWIAIAPDGTMHGPFNGHGAAMTFVGGQLKPAPKPKPKPQLQPATKTRRPMTDPDIAQLRLLHAQGETDGMIARQMGRAQPVISSWRRKLGLPSNGTFQHPGGSA